VKRKRYFEDIFVNLGSLIITLGISFLLVIILILFLSKEPGKTIHFFFIGPFLNKYYFGNMLNASIPLIFTGLGIAIAFTASTFNLGGEGQVYSGALTATVVCLALPALPGIVGGSLAITAAIAVGALLAGLSGYFRMKWGTAELISSFLISGAVVLIVNYFITGPLDDPGNNLLATREIAKQYQFLQIFPPSKLDISGYFAVGVAFLVFFFMYYTHRGYEMRMCGLNREFARYGGIKTQLYLVFPMVLSGALHGLAGAVSVMGTYHMSLKGFSFGMGWNGIAVALIAKNNPIAVIPAAIFFAYIEAGAKAAMIHSDVTFEIAAVVESIIFFLVTAQVLQDFIKYRKRASE